VRVRAFAKINLALRVIGRRSDGYHELRTVFQSIALHDTLTIRRVKGPFRLACSDPRLPVDGGNLVARAAAELWKASGRRGDPAGVAIDLLKRIPIAGGLGGGSSDAAAALRALGTIWRVDTARIRSIAPAIGADVPYFLEGGTVLGLERGDLLFPLADHAKAWVVLVVPPFGVSTQDAYRWLDELTVRQAQDERRGEGLAGRERPHSLALSLSKGELQNDLQGPVVARHPEIGRIVTALRRAGASHAAMSGSGAAVFGLFSSRSQARTAAQSLATARRLTIVTRMVTRAECRRLAAK